jgi:hypothetical protein
MDRANAVCFYPLHRVGAGYTVGIRLYSNGALPGCYSSRADFSNGKNITGDDWLCCKGKLLKQHA